MNPLVMKLQHQGSSSQKSEIVSPHIPTTTLKYLNIFGTYLPASRQFGSMYTIWYYFMSFCFAGYVAFFAIFGIVEIIYEFGQYFWVLYFTMLIKCAVLRRSVFEIRKRLDSEQFSGLLSETESVVPRARSYFTYALMANFLAILFYDAVWMSHFFSVANLFISAMFMLGTMVFTGYMAAIILFCLADAKYAQNSLQAAIAKARQGQLTPGMYSEIQLQINFIVKNSFWIDGAMLIFILVNTLSAIVLLLAYDKFLSGYSALEVLSFVTYVLVVMWAVDAAFILFIIPEIAEVNETFADLHVALAESKFEDRDLEIARYDTLHLVIAKPIRYLIAGFHFTRGAVRGRVFGIFFAMIVFILRMIILLVLEHGG